MEYKCECKWVSEIQNATKTNRLIIRDSVGKNNSKIITKLWAGATRKERRFVLCSCWKVKKKSHFASKSATVFMILDMMRKITKIFFYWKYHVFIFCPTTRLIRLSVIYWCITFLANQKHTAHQ